MSIGELPDRIVDATVDPNLSALGQDMLEFGIDQVLENGVLKDIPVVGIIAKSIGAAMSIRDRIFMQKVARFLFQMKDTPKEDLKKFRDKIESDSQFKRKVGEQLVLIMDRLDDLRKPEMIAKCFQAYLTEEIDFETYRRLCSAIDKGFIEDLKVLTQLYEPTNTKTFKMTHAEAKVAPTPSLALHRERLIQTG